MPDFEEQHKFSTKKKVPWPGQQRHPLPAFFRQGKIQRMAGKAPDYFE